MTEAVRNERTIPKLVAQCCRQPHRTTSSSEISYEDGHPTKQKNFVQFDRSPASKAYPYAACLQNTIAEALKIKTFINGGPTRITWAQTRK